ncbi:protein tramtrack, beta isoform-like isoform X1 [Palaemon carinicauda]|uniref:protein tramtrack, beta isoform-like isoform X1 n=1 Tax=Palaemon carinicauda TaxID=392227 RepID=UPI0035B676D2
MTDGLLSLSWNNHKTTFCHILSTLREKERYSDVTLACEGKFYPTHKLVLSTCSEYFEKMFENTPCKHPVILLGKDVKCDELEALLSYMYDGVVSVAQNDLARLIKVAELLQIKGLAVPDEPPQTKRNYSWNSRDDRTSPHPKRRRRDENFSSSQYGKNSSPPVSPLRIEPEQSWDQNNTTEGAPGEDSSQRLDLPRKQEVDIVQSQETAEETLVKEEIVETVDETPNEDPGAEYSSHTGGDTSTGGEEHGSKFIHQLEPIKAQPLHEAVVEALAGPSGMQGWLGTGDMGTGFPILESFSEEGTQDHQPVPVSGTQQPHQMVESQCKGPASTPAVSAGNNLKSTTVDSAAKEVRSPTDPSTAKEVRSPTDPSTAKGVRSPADPSTAKGVRSPADPSTAKGVRSPTDPSTAQMTGTIQEGIPTQVSRNIESCISMVSSSDSASTSETKETTKNLSTVAEDANKKQQVEPQYQCKICCFMSHVQSDFHKHMQKHHPFLEKIYRCDTCNYSTTTKGSLSQHVRIHTGEKPFACQYCDYRANQKSHISQHMVKHYKNFLPHKSPP